MTVNQNMNIHQVRMYRRETQRVGWGPIPEDVKNAFLNKQFRIVTLPMDTRLYKFTAYRFTGRFSPWWCTVNPYREDTMGLNKTLQAAALNGVSFQTYVRLANAVRYDWNHLTRLQIIRLNESARGLWGQFEPQPCLSPGLPPNHQQGLQQESPFMPPILGGMGTWQLWIPNLDRNNTQLLFDSDNEGLMRHFTTVNLPRQHQAV